MMMPPKTRCRLYYLPVTDKIIVSVQPGMGFTYFETECGKLEPAQLIDKRRKFLSGNWCPDPIVTLDEWEED